MVNLSATAVSRDSRPSHVGSPHGSWATRAIVVAILALLAVASWSLCAANGATKLKFTAPMTSIATTLNTLPGGHTYGWNHFTGTTRIGGQDVAVDFLGSVNYVNGSGPYEGFITLTWPDGVTLALRIDGRARATETPSGSYTDLNGFVKIIQGTDDLEGVTGFGTATGYRKGGLGSPIVLTFTLTVLGIDP